MYIYIAHVDIYVVEIVDISCFHEWFSLQVA